MTGPFIFIATKSLKKGKLAAEIKRVAETSLAVRAMTMGHNLTDRRPAGPWSAGPGTGHPHCGTGHPHCPLADASSISAA